MPTIALNADGSLSADTIKLIEQELYKLTEEYSIETYPAEHRTHLGASIIGDKCSRNLWYNFRWVKLNTFDARMRRLFNRGHREEERFKDILTWMGFFVREIDPNTDKQYNFSAVGGHYGGSNDSLALMPWIRDENFRILVEYKTHNDNQFQKLKKDGVKISHYKHWVQMCSYGAEWKTRYGLYCAVNKDTDEIYYEFLELDWRLADQMKRKAQDIITTQFPPQRLSEQPSYFECKYCNHHGICHYNEPVEINCRSCRFAVPQDKAEWKCTKWNAIIPKTEIPKGCPSHISINAI